MHIQDLRLPLEKGNNEARKIYKERTAWIFVAGLIGIIASIIVIHPISSLLLIAVLVLLLVSLLCTNSSGQKLLLMQVMILAIALTTLTAYGSQTSVVWNDEQESENEYTEGLIRRLAVK